MGHDLSGAAFAQQRAEEAEAEATRLRAKLDAANESVRVLEKQLRQKQRERDEEARWRRGAEAERDAARAAAAAWKRSAKMWRAWGVMAERVVTHQKHIDVMGLVYFHARELSDD